MFLNMGTDSPKFQVFIWYVILNRRNIKKCLETQEKILGNI